MHREQVLAEFKASRNDFERLGVKLAEQIKHKIAKRQVKIHGVTYRVKSLESLSGKIARPDRIYHHATDVTDLLGIRVITYFEDGVTQVGEILEEMFDIDFQRSTDKNRVLDSNAFGYRSLHYICHTPNPVGVLSPGSIIEQSCFEVQVCTILQHAWAEIEHDLGYKYEYAVPRSIRRKFSRLAGILEIVDEEFVSIRRFLDAYQRDIGAQIQDASERVQIDAVSLTSFVRSEAVAGLDARLACQLDKPVSETVFFPDYLVKMLNHTGIFTIRQLELAFANYEGLLTGFMPRYFEFSEKSWNFGARHMPSFPRGYSVFLLVYLLLLDSSSLELQKIENVALFFERMDYPGDEAAARRVAATFWEVVREFWETERHLKPS